MGKEKYQKDIRELFKKSPVVSFDSIERIVKNKTNANQYTKQLVRNLILKGKIKKIGKGYYTSHDETSLAVFYFKPAYLGLQDALSHHNLWEQETITVIITPRKVRQGIRRIMGTNILVRRIEKKYFFGIGYGKEPLYLPYSDIEKTFIDMVYFKQKISEEAKENLVKSINKKKLNSYLKIYPGSFRKKVLGHLKK
jgi:predicted transcriptional regulator of viral defense system